MERARREYSGCWVNVKTSPSTLDGSWSVEEVKCICGAKRFFFTFFGMTFVAYMYVLTWWYLGQVVVDLAWNDAYWASEQRTGQSSQGVRDFLLLRHTEHNMTTTWHTYNTHDTRHTTHDTRHTTHDTWHIRTDRQTSCVRCTHITDVASEPSERQSMNESTIHHPPSDQSVSRSP